ncbi:MAG: hypothetical protein WCO98_13270, partial [bacterium]
MKFLATLLLILISTAVMAQYPVMVSPPDVMTNAPSYLRFSWLPMRMATQYQVNISQTPLLDTDAIVASTLTVTVYRIDSRYNTKTELFPSTPFLLNGTYYWHVRACNDTYDSTVFPPNANWTSWSPARSFTVHGGIPVAIAPYDTAKMISATPRIQWTPVRDAKAYRLQISTNADMTTPSYQIETTNTYVDFSTPMYYLYDGTSTIYTYQASPLTTVQLNTLPQLGPLHLGQKYYWKLYAYIFINDISEFTDQSANSSVYNFTTYGGAPLIKAPVNNASVTSVQPTFLWTPVKGASQYRFTLSADNFATTLLTVTVNSATNYTLTASQKLLIGKTYYWRVQALNSTTPITDTQSRSNIVSF